MASVLIHGTKSRPNRAERIAAAIACTAYLRDSRKVIILPMTTKYKTEDVLVGHRAKGNTVRGRGYTFDDNGMDALCRRLEQNDITAEAFSDCCVNLAKIQNGLDIAGCSKRADFDDYVVRNSEFFNRLIKNAEQVYDLVIVVADAEYTDTIGALQKMTTTELTIISQGVKVDIFARPDTLYCINDYDGASIYNYKTMKEIYGIASDHKIYPFPYNIRFKDACRMEDAISFMTSNVKSEQSDDNYVFTECVAKLTKAILGMEEPLIKERRFVVKERPEGKRGKRNAI